MGKDLIKGNMMIAQSGGPTVVINQSLVAAVTEAKKHRHIKGIMEEMLVDLRKETPSVLSRVACTPCAALGSVRKKPNEQDCAEIFRMLQKYDVRFFFKGLAGCLRMYD